MAFAKAHNLQLTTLDMKSDARTYEPVIDMKLQIRVGAPETHDPCL